MTVRNNLITVLERIKREVEIADEDDVEVWAESLENVLEEMVAEDFFGTEGQSDPRGDHRSGDWYILGKIQERNIT